MREQIKPAAALAALRWAGKDAEYRKAWGKKLARARKRARLLKQKQEEESKP